MQINKDNLSAPRTLHSYQRILGIGGARCGTTYMWTVLSSFPEVCDAGVKEHHFYDSVMRKGFNGNIGWTQEKLTKVSNKCVSGVYAEDVKKFRMFSSSRTRATV